jgi:hypothetical protein
VSFFAENVSAGAVFGEDAFAVSFFVEDVLVGAIFGKVFPASFCAREVFAESVLAGAASVMVSELCSVEMGFGGEIFAGASSTGRDDVLVESPFGGVVPVGGVEKISGDFFVVEVLTGDFLAGCFSRDFSSGGPLSRAFPSRYVVIAPRSWLRIASKITSKIAVRMGGGPKAARYAMAANAKIYQESIMMSKMVRIKYPPTASAPTAWFDCASYMKLTYEF